VTENTLVNNPTAQVMVVSYPKPFTDKAYNPSPRGVRIGMNIYSGGGDDPQLPGGKQFALAFGGALPPILWDGIGEVPTALGRAEQRGISLGLASQGADPATAKPAPIVLKPFMPQIVPLAPGMKLDRPPAPGAPAALDSRARP
jgi:hypothetical protein